MGPPVYILGILTTLACALLLLRGFAHGRKRLLLWSGLCFVGLTISNLLRFMDLVILPDVDLYLWRLLAAAIAMALMVYGLIWDSD
jgi:heme/copper-type cytochrome/quinol oxidase subunit 4